MAHRAAARLLARVMLLALGLTPAAQAHLMVAQKGTLNFNGTGAYLLLSLPVAAFTGVDADGDGRLSLAELQDRSADIEAQVQARVRLLDGQDGGQDGGRALALQGVMLQLSPPDDPPGAPATQLVVMGRYAVGAVPWERLRFSLDLFGPHTAEQTQGMSFTRQGPSHAAVFTPEARTQAVFPSAQALFLAQLRSGVTHVLSGLDHVLFLLVVLASSAMARLGWRHLVWALSCFTAGHAASIGASLWGGLTLSPALVEPAIAATIVGMAWLDLRQRRRASAPSARAHLTCVSGCAVIHGLGLADALNGLKPDSAHLLWSLAGFNIGVELAQLGVAAVALAASGMLTWLGGPARARQAAQATAMIGLAVGSWWFIDRLGMMA